MSEEIEHPKLGLGVILAVDGSDWVVRFDTGIVRVRRDSLPVLGSVPLEIRGFETEWILQQYHPYRHGRNEAFGPHDSRVLALKRGERLAVDFFAEEFAKILPTNSLLACVPSHNPVVTQTGIAQVVSLLIGRGWGDARRCVVRTRFIPRLSSGGDRSLDAQLSSLQVRDVERIRSQRVVMLDDVRTTGNSLKAAYQLLKEAGAKAVKRVAIAQTA